MTPVLAAAFILTGLILTMLCINGIIAEVRIGRQDKLLAECMVRIYCDHHARQRFQAEVEYKLEQVWVAHNLLMASHNEWAAYWSNNLHLLDDDTKRADWWRDGTKPEDGE